jgi:hypothetical protein
MLLVLGEAGIGKTRLLEELLDWAARQGVERASARCYAAEGELAYAPVAALLRARPLPTLDDVWLAEVARLLPELRAKHPDLSPARPMTEAWQRVRLFEALARAVLGTGRPLLLAVDDLHWCDARRWVAHFLLRFDSRRAVRRGTCRPEELAESAFSVVLPPFTATCLDRARARPAGRAETAAWPTPTARLTPPPPPGSTARPRQPPCRGDSAPPGRGRRAGRKRPAAPGAGVLERRLAQLSPGRELAGLAAASAVRSPSVLQHAGEGDEDASSRLDELWQRRIVRERGAGAYDFAHDKLREAAYGTLSPARRRLLHRRVAQALETVHHADLDPVSRQVAGHYRQAGQPEEAIPYYLRAGQVAGRLYAVDEAVTCFRQGLALLAEGTLAPR